MSRRLLLLSIGALLLLPASPALGAPADVTVRAEGTGGTLVPSTALRTSTAPVNKDGMAGHDCTGTSAAGALQAATGGDWAGTWFDGLGYSVERIRSERHAFPEPDFFELWINNRSSSVGICEAELQSGDEVLFLVGRCEVGPAPDFACTNAPVLPLGLQAPSRVTPGVPFGVRVVEYAPSSAASPAAGATVSGGDAPVVTDGAGNATVTVGTAGARTLRATRADRVRTAPIPVCATSGTDGQCASPGPSVAGPACTTSGDDGRCATRDRRAPLAQVIGIDEKERFRRGRGPRELQARIPDDPSGILTVKLRLTRNDGGRCSYFSGRRERQVFTRCGTRHGRWFAVGDRQEVSYLLPGRLPRGRYVLDVNVVDKAYNRDDRRRRTGNRVVFHVG